MKNNFDLTEILNNAEKAKENFKKLHSQKYKTEYIPTKGRAVLLYNIKTNEVERFATIKECINKLDLWKDHLLESMEPQLKKRGYILFGYEDDILAEVEND